VRSYPVVLPAAIPGVQRHLGSGLTKGIGAVTAGRMVAHFGTGIWRAISEEPQRRGHLRGGPDVDGSPAGSRLR
jgi:exodeoxyribonuclease V alpha subunit